MQRVQATEAAITAEGRDATLIEWHERDRVLDLHEESWGENLEPPWQPVDTPARHFRRELRVSDNPDIRMAEHIARFPSVPIYGINRKADYKIRFPRRPNMHTLRVLRDTDHGMPVTRVFIFHNGLNETRNLRFYYRLASWILEEDRKGEHRTACIVAPFPGHLMHAPFPGPFVQSPLARYISDSGDLFRQFLRYMVEMRWLLSLLVQRRPDHWMVGGEPIEKSRLATTLTRECAQLREASLRIWEERRMEAFFEGGERIIDERTERQLIGEELDRSSVQSSLDTLSELLGLGAREESGQLPVHVLGYSLGGFLAQSVFFAWPNIVSSCTTICSGGAIRALSPTAFAHSEEWQAVLHTLRPELEEAMLGQRVSRACFRIAGMDEEHFDYYQRIFDQVFLQEDNASYKARLSEYISRLLFVSGGDDPIVKTREVLDAAPKEGITMLSVAGLTHFLGESPRSHREVEQREYWLPEAGGLIARATGRAQELHQQERQDARAQYAKTQKLERDRAMGRLGTPTGSPEKPGQRDLGSPEFERALDWVIDGVLSDEPGPGPSVDGPGDSGKAGEGWLFVCRSGVPAAFLDAEMHRAWGAGLHHHDVNIQNYVAGLTQRAAWLEALEDRMTLVLPDGLQRTFVESSSGLVDPHSDAPGYLMTEAQHEHAWRTFIERWGRQIRWLDAGPFEDEDAEFDVDAKAKAAFVEAATRWQRVPAAHLAVTHPPDVWIMVDSLQLTFTQGKPEEAIEQFVKWVANVLEKEPPVPVQGGSPPEKAESKVGKRLEADLTKGRVRIIKVSGTELNPRYRGRCERAFWPALSLMAHCAAALVRSRPESAE